jgi:REP element-mobilizing transposase RayT
MRTIFDVRRVCDCLRVARVKQPEFVFRTWGGKRRGAGRKRRAERPQVKHRTRPDLDGRTPAHVTLRLRPEIGRLRRRDQYRAVRKALVRAAHRDDFRICQYSIQSNHLHLVCEPHTKGALSRGMMAFKSSCAKRLNALVGRTGAVFADRYHWRRHGEHRGHSDWYVDPYSSADFFDGWTGGDARRPWWLGPDDVAPVAEAHFWLLAKGWRRHGTIHPKEVPGPKETPGAKQVPGPKRTTDRRR